MCAMNHLCDLLLWATIACVVLTFVFLAIAVVMLVVSALWLEVRAVFGGGSSQDYGVADETAQLSILLLLGLMTRAIFGGWSGD